MKKFLLLAVGLLFLALLLAPLTIFADPSDAADNNALLAEAVPENGAEILAWNEGSDCPQGPPCGPPGWSGKPNKPQLQTAVMGNGRNKCPQGPPCGPPGWAKPPGWIPGPPGWSRPNR